MKKIDLVHTTLLIVGILAGYLAIVNIITALATLSIYGLEGGFEQVAYFFFVCLCPAIAGIVIIRNGRSFAEVIMKNDPEGSWEQPSYWDLDRRNIIFVLFIGIGLYTLIAAIPSLLVHLYQLFAEKVTPALLRTPDVNKNTLATDLLRITIGTLLIYASPTLTNFIEQTIAVRLDIKKENKQEE
ncbi:MAG TPA: hypothetical protein VHC96_22415 [Puia sp.]|jgi:hypothetical protein|nr:hypothetical protein [Puia sp.]